MKNKLVYDNKNIKVYSILILSHIIFNYIYQFGSTLIDESYIGFGDVGEDIFSALFNAVISCLPELICITLFAYNKIKPKHAMTANKLLKIYVYVKGGILATVVVIMGIPYLVSYLFCLQYASFSPIIQDLLSENQLLFVLYTFLKAVFLLVLGIFLNNKKVYSVSKVALLIIESLRAVVYLYNLFDGLIAGSFESSATSNVMNLILNASFVIAETYILLFGVFKREPSADELLEKLNKNYTSGKISKEDYDAQRQKIIDSI